MPGTGATEDVKWNQRRLGVQFVLNFFLVMFPIVLFRYAITEILESSVRGEDGQYRERERERERTNINVHAAMHTV